MNSLRSAPAEKASPVPMRMTARSWAPSRAAASATCSARTIDGLSALRASGRFSRSARTASVRLSRGSQGARGPRQPVFQSARGPLDPRHDDALLLGVEVEDLHAVFLAKAAVLGP